MLKKPFPIIFFFIVAIILFFLYQEWKVPDGVIPQGKQENMNAQFVFWGGVLAFSTAVIGLIQKVIELILVLRKSND